MKKLFQTLAITLFSFSTVNAQTKIKDGTVTGSSSLPNAASVLELESNNKGLLLPRVNLTSTTVWGLTGTPVNGMMVYDTTTAITGNAAYPAAFGGKGIYYWDGTGWVAPSSPKGWLLTGNTGTTAPASVGTAVGSANYWGTTDAKNLAVGTNGITRMIFDIAGNAYGGTDNSYVTPASASGGNNRNFIWGRADSLVDPSGAGNHNSNAIFGSFNKVVGGTASYGSTNVVGGGFNTVAASASAVFGNSNTDSALLTVVGGGNNKLTTQAGGSIVVGGSLTAIDGNYLSGTNAAVFGKSNLDSASYTLVAGSGNVVSAAAFYSAAIGKDLVATQPQTVYVNNINSAGSVSASIRNLSSSQTLLNTDFTIIASGTAIKIFTLPAPGSNTGKLLNIKDISTGGGSASLSGSINGVTSTTMTVGSTGQNVTQLQCDGITWWVLANN